MLGSTQNGYPHRYTHSLYSSVVEHWSRKPGVESSNLSGGIRTLLIFFYIISTIGSSIRISRHHWTRVCGLMDKAPDFGSGDCRFESCHARHFIFGRNITLRKISVFPGANSYCIPGLMESLNLKQMCAPLQNPKKCHAVQSQVTENRSQIVQLRLYIY